MPRPLFSTRLTRNKPARVFRWLLAVLLIAALVIGLFHYSAKVVKECTAAGGTTLWCVATLRLQSWKHLWH